MKLLFFLLILLGSGGGIYAVLSSTNQKVSALKMDLMLSKQQLVQLQNKCRTLNTEKTNFNIEFITPEYKSGVLPKNTSLYLYPEKSSPVLQKTSSNMQVEILDCAVTSSKWYYISLPIDSNINCNGWVISDDFLTLETYSRINSEINENQEDLEENIEGNTKEI